MGTTEEFETERPRLTGLATRVLGDHAEAEDIVQQAWLRLHRTDTEIESLPAWLTTVTTRLCLDRLRSRTPVPHDEIPAEGTAPDAADEVVLADTVGVALQAVIDRLTPGERVAFVLHDSFGFEFATIAAILDTTPAAARKLASRARAKVRGTSGRGSSLAQPSRADAQVVDAFMAAAREGDFASLLRLHAALPVLVGDRPGAAWFHRGEAKVLFDFAVEGGRVHGITFRAEESALARVVRRQ